MDEILKLIDKPLAERELLANERYRYLMNQLEILDEEYLNVFKNIIINNSIIGFENYFTEEDVNEFNRIFSKKNIKENFNAMSFILDSFYTFKE